MQFTITNGRQSFSKEGSWDFIHGMELAEKTFINPSHGYPLIVRRFDDFFCELDIRKSRSPLSGFWTMTRFNTECSSYHLNTAPYNKRYRWGDYQFDSVDFIEGFVYGANLLGVDPSELLINPIEDVIEEKPVSISHFR